MRSGDRSTNVPGNADAHVDDPVADRLLYHVPDRTLTAHREIIDESDVYVDVHKAIRRANPAPKAWIQRKEILLRDAAAKDGVLVDLIEEGDDQLRRTHPASLSGRNETTLSSSPKTTAFFVRKGSAGQTVSVKANLEDMREHLKHLGPSNPASNPKSTRVSAVKIKPGVGHAADQRLSESVATETVVEDPDGDADEHTSLLRHRYGREDSPQRYGSRTTGVREPTNNGSITVEVDAEQPKNNSTGETSPTDSIGSNLSVPRRQRGHARSGSITEDVIEAGGVRKVVLKLTSPGGHSYERPPTANTSSCTTPNSHTRGEEEEEGRKERKARK